MPAERSTMSHIFDSVMALCACGTRFWPRDKHDTKCYGCQTEERIAQGQAAADSRGKQEERDEGQG